MLVFSPFPLGTFLHETKLTDLNSFRLPHNIQADVVLVKINRLTLYIKYELRKAI